MGGGVYITVTHNLPNSGDRIHKLCQTDSIQNVNVRLFDGTDMINSVGPNSECNIPNFQFGMLYIDHHCIACFVAF